MTNSDILTELKAAFLDASRACHFADLDSVAEDFARKTKDRLMALIDRVETERPESALHMKLDAILDRLSPPVTSQCPLSGCRVEMETTQLVDSEIRPLTSMFLNNTES